MSTPNPLPNPFPSPEPEPDSLPWQRPTNPTPPTPGN